MTSRLTGLPSADELLDAAEKRVTLSGIDFGPGGEFTVGAEEELILVGGDHQLLGAADRLARAIDPGADGTVSTELFAAEIEFATSVCHDGEQVSGALRRLRTRLQEAGGVPMAVGVHPAAPFGEAELTAAPRYATIGANLAGLLRTPTAALQVHVGMPDPESAVNAVRGLRHQLPLLRALACGSPYWHGRDSGLASARWAVVESYPRGGVPPVVHSWEEYVALTEAVVAAAGVPDYTYVWWDVRAQPLFGTVEVRVMDAQPSLDVVAGLVALTQGLARHAAEQPLPVDVPTEVLTENDFLVARHGLDAQIVDVDGSVRPVRDLAARAVAEARALLRPDGFEAPLDAVDRLLRDEPEYERHRRIHATSGMAGVLSDLVARTSVTD